MRNHGFTGGNKRTALYLVELLVRRSDYEFLEDDGVVADTIISVARGDTDYEEFAAWFRERLIRRGNGRSVEVRRAMRTTLKN